jgi:hypothetical protein
MELRYTLEKEEETLNIKKEGLAELFSQARPSWGGEKRR